ncbi:hypothetical protein C8J56DRAFT_221310 [Mycena floridula]|nr:hypothetical protein C8J56DRAFT_221310 [Mycena floridula]
MRSLECKQGFPPFRGPSQQCHELRFSLSLSLLQYQAIEMWKDRMKSMTTKVQESLCCSLGCYSFSDLVEKTGGDRDFSTLNNNNIGVFNHIASWPKSGGLVLEASFDGSKITIPMSPPTKVTPEGLVDLSPFLNVGSNTIALRHRSDMSKYLFVLHVHHPTRAQLQSVVQGREKEKSWQNWARHAARPMVLEIPSSRLSTPNQV